MHLAFFFFHQYIFQPDRQHTPHRHGQSDDAVKDKQPTPPREPVHAVHPRVQRRLLCHPPRQRRKHHERQLRVTRALTRYPLNMDPMKADAKKMHALFASSVYSLRIVPSARPGPRIGTEEQGVGVGGGKQTLFGVPAAQHRVHCRVERAFCQADLLSARTYTRARESAEPCRAKPNQPRPTPRRNEMNEGTNGGHLPGTGRRTAGTASSRPSWRTSR